MDDKRGWSHARDYVEMQWLMLQQEKPKEYDIANGVHYSLLDLVAVTAKEIGMEAHWKEKAWTKKVTGKHLKAKN